VARGTCAKAVRTLRNAGIVYVVTGKGSVSLREGKAA
jgi:DNA-binding GntR family transcriptional regulator